MRRGIILTLIAAILSGGIFVSGILVERHWLSGMNQPDAVAPKLVSPMEGAVLNNGDPSKDISLIWEFKWSDVRGADQYHLHVVHENRTTPIVNVWVDEPHHRFLFERGYIGGTERELKGWTWKVRAHVGGQWSRWSAVQSFNVQPPAK